MNPRVLKRQTSLNNKSCNATAVESKKMQIWLTFKKEKHGLWWDIFYYWWLTVPLSDI